MCSLPTHLTLAHTQAALHLLTLALLTLPSAAVTLPMQRSLLNLLVVACVFPL
jgi:hypothetical protein